MNEQDHKDKPYRPEDFAIDYRQLIGLMVWLTEEQRAEMTERMCEDDEDELTPQRG